MKHHTRRAIAYIAGRLISKKNSSSVYDYSASQYFNFGGTVELARASVFDYDQSCHVSGTLPNIFHYGNSSHISLKIEGCQFSGFDYGESSHFSGKVNGSSVLIYDYGCSQYFNYSI